MSHFPFSEYYKIDIKWKATILNFLSDNVMDTKKIKTRLTFRKERLCKKHKCSRDGGGEIGWMKKMWMNAWCVDEW